MAGLLLLRTFFLQQNTCIVPARLHWQLFGATLGRREVGGWCCVRSVFEIDGNRNFLPGRPSPFETLTLLHENSNVSSWPRGLTWVRNQWIWMWSCGASDHHGIGGCVPDNALIFTKQTDRFISTHKNSLLDPLYWNQNCSDSSTSERSVEIKLYMIF